MTELGDILWVEDFDDGDSSPLESKIKKWYPPSCAFRVDAKTSMYHLLDVLETGENFSRYTCAVLDINLQKGFNTKETEVREEYDNIKRILEKNQIRILDDHDPEEVGDYTYFRKNAGYYVYLYLIQRGMPSSRICMLTGNKGSSTEDWDTLFKDAGLIPPEAFDKVVEIKDFHDWLSKALTPAFRLRSCIIGMSFYAEKLLEDETLKVHVQNLYRIPLRLSEDKETAPPEFISALWQILQIWESHEDSNRAYQMTLKTARNWFAHCCLKKISLLTAAFLFGIGMRGLLGESIRKKIDATSDDENINGYKCWERELLSLIEEFDKRKASVGKKEIGALVMESCQEFFTRVKNSPENFKIELTTEICTLIAQTIGQKKNNIKIYEEDLLRSFLHGVYTIEWRGDGRIYDKPNHALGIVFDFDKEKFKRLENSQETKYLNAVKNTLFIAINRK